MGDNHKTFNFSKVSQEPVYRNANIYIKASTCSVYSKLLKPMFFTNKYWGPKRSSFKLQYYNKISNEYMIKSKEPGTMPQFVMLPNYASILRVDSKLFNCNPWANPGSSEGFQSLI